MFPAGSDRGSGSSGIRCVPCGAPDEALAPLMGSGDESGDVNVSLRFLPLRAPTSEPGGFPTATASLAPAVGGRPSGLYCVPVLTYAPAAADELLSNGICLSGCWGAALLCACVRRGEWVEKARGECRVAAAGERALDAGPVYDARGLGWWKGLRGECEGEEVRVDMKLTGRQCSSKRTAESWS